MNVPLTKDTRINEQQLAAARKSLHEAAKVTERMLSIAPAIVLALDARGTITLLNTQGCTVLECRFEEVAGRSWFDLFVPDRDRDQVREIFRQLMAEQTEPNLVAGTVLTREGNEKTIRWYNTVLHDEKGSASGTLSYGEEVTGQIEAEEKIRRLQQFQQSVIANANIWITVLDSTGTILVWNDAAEAISGYARGEVLGNNRVWKDMYPDNEYRREVTSTIQRIIGRDTYLENFETEIHCADGTQKTIIWNTRGIRDTAGSSQSYIAIGRDVTHQKQAEEEIRTLNRDLEKRVEERTCQLNQSLAEKETLLREVHHRVKNNLQIISSLLNLQIRKIDDPRTIEVLKDSQTRVLSMALVHEHLYKGKDFSRIDVRNYINALGTQIFQSYGAANEGIRFDLSIPAISVDINTAIPLGLIINELITNSLKYAFKGRKDGKISITATEDTHALTIIIADNGTGMPEGITLENQTSLGLRLINTLTGQLHGTVAIDRTEGTRFLLTFPKPAETRGGGVHDSKTG